MADLALVRQTGACGQATASDLTTVVILLARPQTVLHVFLHHVLLGLFDAARFAQIAKRVALQPGHREMNAATLYASELCQAFELAVRSRVVLEELQLPFAFKVALPGLVIIFLQILRDNERWPDN